MPLRLKANNKVLILAVVFVVVAVVLFVVISRGGSGSTPYSNPFFHISLEYPDDWEVDPAGGAFQDVPLHFSGYGGYFGIDAISGDETVAIDEIANALAKENPNSPYGSNPTIKNGVVGGMEAVFIFPSRDQPETANSEAVVVVRYPSPVIIGDFSYPFFMLYGDKSHLDGLANTLQFIGYENEQKEEFSG